MKNLKVIIQRTLWGGVRGSKFHDIDIMTNPHWNINQTWLWCAYWRPNNVCNGLSKLCKNHVPWMKRSIKVLMVWIMGRSLGMAGGGDFKSDKYYPVFDWVKCSGSGQTAIPLYHQHPLPSNEHIWRLYSAFSSVQPFTLVNIWSSDTRAFIEIWPLGGWDEREHGKSSTRVSVIFPGRAVSGWWSL